MAVISSVEDLRILAQKRLNMENHTPGKTIAGQDRRPLPAIVADDAGIDTP